MIIKSIKLHKVNFPLIKPFSISYASYKVMPSIIVQINCDNGVVGYGESVPDEHVTGESVSSTYEVIKSILAPKLIGVNVKNIEKIHSLMDSLILGCPTAKAAIDIACFDAIGKVLNIPVYQLLGGKFHDSYEIAHVLSIQSPLEMAKEAKLMIKQGFKHFKLKVGSDKDIDVKRIKEVYKETKSIAKLRVDVNQGWKNSSETLKALSQLENVEIEWIEQPVKADDIDGLSEVKRKSNFTIMADEALLYKKELKQLVEKQACDKINIKLMKCGGIYKAKKLATMAEIANIDCQIGSMVESSIGSAAGYHVAFSQENITSAELTGPLKFKKDIGDLHYDLPKITLSEKPGLGVNINLDTLSELTFESNIIQ